MKYTLIFYNRSIFVYVLQLLSLTVVVTVNRDLRLISRLPLFTIYSSRVIYHTDCNLLYQGPMPTLCVNAPMRHNIDMHTT